MTTTKKPRTRSSVTDLQKRPNAQTPSFDALQEMRQVCGVSSPPAPLV